MKSAFFLPVVSLLLVSCVGPKELSIDTAPEGAEITINGEYVGKTPLVTTIAQDKALGIVARKSGYEIGSETLVPTSSPFLSFVWTENDPKAKYIEEDSVTIPLKKIPTPSSYTPSIMPKYTGGGGSTSAALPEVPALRPMPDLD
ncbi:MAG: PEGA domain-containing protein [Akkermansia sp.]|nr:PEGA domain-containing protein [Akkermansia sp.]